jgi:apolipoprotein N-acyltransferase
MKAELSKWDSILIVSSAAIGYAGFSTVPRAAALVLAVPVLWTLAGSRSSAFAVILAYKLTASRGLLYGAAVFLPEDRAFMAAALYPLMSISASLPFLVFWDERGRRKAMAVVPAFLAAYMLPPMSLVGIGNPLMASGTIFRGCGFAGISAVLAIYALCAVSGRTAYSFLCVIALFAALPPDSWYEPPKPEGIAAVDTSFGRLGSGSFDFEMDYERTKKVFDDLRRRGIGKTGAQTIVLPETIAGRLNRTGLELWKEEIQRQLPDKAVIFGAMLPTGDGMKYDNAALMLRDGKIIASAQRIPVLYSMYLGPFAESGANLHLTGNGILKLPDGRMSAVIICYETFLTWPFLVSMIHKPDVIVCMANLWWCGGTSLPAVQKAAVSLWALAFGVPAVFARNF